MLKIFAGTVYPNYSEYGCYYVVAANTAEEAKETIIKHIRDERSRGRDEPLTLEGAIMLIGGIPYDGWYLMEVGYTEDYKEPRVISEFIT